MTYHPPPSQRPTPPAPVPTSGSDTSWLLWAGLAVAILAWPLALLAMLTLPQLKRHPARAGWLAAGGIALFLLCARPLKTHLQTSKAGIVAARAQKSVGLVAKRAGGALPWIWLYTAPLGPAAAYAWREVRPKPLEEREADKLRLADEQQQRRMRTAMKKAAKLANTDQTVLGIKIEGESIHLFREQPDGQIWIETTGSVANLHMFLPGESGAGKVRHTTA